VDRLARLEAARRALAAHDSATERARDNGQVDVVADLRNRRRVLEQEIRSALNDTLGDDRP
jgi:hypothetical protein